MTYSRTAVLALLLALSGSMTEVRAAPRWHHETMVYFQVLELGKCECTTAFVRSWQRADTLTSVEENRAAMRTAKADRKACNRAAKQRAHEAYLQARKERVEARRLRENPR